jgi:hypothetical protein
MSNNNNAHQLNYNLLNKNPNIHIIGQSVPDYSKKNLVNNSLKALMNCYGPTVMGSIADTTSSISSMSDIEIDDSHIKEEPLSPHSSCPPSPQNYNNMFYNPSNVMAPVNLSSISIGQNEMIYDNKVCVFAILVLINPDIPFLQSLKNPQMSMDDCSMAAVVSPTKIAKNIKVENPGNHD